MADLSTVKTNTTYNGRVVVGYGKNFDYDIVFPRTYTDVPFYNASGVFQKLNDVLATRFDDVTYYSN